MVTRFSALGDVAMTIPVVYDTCRANAGVDFVMVTRRGAEALFVNPPANLKVVGVDLNNDFDGPAGMVKLFRHIMSLTGGIDMMADLHDVLRTKMLRAMARLNGVTTAKIDKERRAKQQIAASGDWAVAEPPQLKTSFERYADVFKKLGLKVAEPGFTSVFAADEPLADISAITAEKQAGEKWIGVAPFAAHEPKVYPADLMERLVGLLAQHPGAKLFFFGGGSDEQRAIGAWIDGRDNCVSLAGRRLGFATELELLRRMDVMVSMDSANMHFASLTATPVVSVWGATHPCFGFMGWRQKLDNSVAVKLDCRPCSVYGNVKCHRGDFKCMRSITPESIMEKVNHILSN